MSTADSEHNWTQNIFKNAPVGMLIVNNRVITRINKIFCELSGYSENELIGQSTEIGYLDKAEYERVGQILYDQISKSGYGNAEAKLKHKNGSIIDVLISSSISNGSLGDGDIVFAIIDITERNLAKERLKSEKEFTETAINAQVDTLFIFDPSTGKPIRWNDSFSRLSGYSDAEIASMKAPDDWYDKDDLSKVSNINDTISRDGHVTVEMSLITKSRQRILTEYRASFINDEEGQPKYIIAIGRDITKSRQTEKKLESEQYFSKSIIQTSPAYFVAIDAEGKTKVMNQTMLKALGYRSEEAIGADYITTFIPTRDRQMLYEIFAKLVNLNEPTVNENSILTKDGRELIVEWHGQPVYDADGRFDFFFGVGIDITERKLAEKEVYKFKTISDRANYGTAIVALEGNIIYINECFASMHGLTIEETIGKHLSIFHTKEQMPAVNKLNKELIKNGYYPATEVWHKRKDGSVFPTMMNATIIKDENNKPLFISASAIDITDRKLAEIELQTAQYFSNSIIRSLPGLFYIFDKESIRFLRRNDSWCEVTGYSDEELNTLTFFDFFTEGSEKDKCAVRVQEVYDTGYSTMENNLLTKSGEKIPYYFTGRRVIIDGKTYLAGMGIDITERKQAEEALRRSETYLKSLFRAAPTGIGVVSDRNLKQVNERMCAMTGYSQKELVGKSARMLYPSDEDFEYVGREKYAQISDHGTGTVETRWLCKDGRVIDVLLSSTPLDINDLSKNVTFTALDITDRKQAEERLRESEEKYSKVANYSYDWEYWVNPKGKFIYVSPSCKRITGYSADEFLQNPKLLLTIVHSDDINFVKNHKHEARKSGEVIPLEYRIITKSGEERWIGHVCQTVYDNNGFDLGLRGCNRDITKRKHMRRELQDSEQRYRSVVENAVEFIWQLDTEGKFVFINNYAEKVSGQKSADWQGKHYSPLIHSDDLTRVNKIHENIVAGNMVEYETRIVVAEEKIVDLEIQSIPIYKDGEVTGTLSFGRDITKRKSAQEALHERERTLDALINAPTETAILIDTKGTILAINRIGAKRHGQKESEIIGTELYDYLPPKLAKSRKAMSNKVIRSGEPIRFQDEREGRYFDHNIYPVFDDRGKVTALAINARDITRHRQAEMMLRSLVEGTAEATGRDFFDKLVQHLATSLNCRHAIIGVINKTEPKQIMTLSCWNKDKITKNYSFEIAGTPCENIDKKNICFYQSQVQKKYPKDKWLAKNKIEAYLGIPILNPKGKPIGILVVMDTRKFSDDLIDGAHSLMAIFASRAAAEIDRISAEDEQRAIADRLRKEQKALFDKHVALKQILEHMETEKLDFRHEISSSLEQALMPFVKKLRNKGGTLSNKDIELFEDAVKSITGTEIDDFKANYAKLTSREMDICDLIKEGESSQEIADTLHLSLQTIQKHRSSIRKKLQLKNKEINLPAYLRYK